MFWEKVDINGILSDPYLIFCGDLNLTLSASEVWGGCSQLDEFTCFFMHLFIKLKFQTCWMFPLLNYCNFEEYSKCILLMEPFGDVIIPLSG